MIVGAAIGGAINGVMPCSMTMASRAYLVMVKLAA